MATKPKKTKVAFQVAIISCVKLKGVSAAPARDLYTSWNFRAMRQYAENHAAAWYILSAKHGVLHPDDTVKPYDRSFKTMNKAERLLWAEGVQQQLLNLLPKRAKIVILAGKEYWENVVPFLEETGFSVSIPMHGLRSGERRKWLKSANGDT